MFTRVRLFFYALAIVLAGAAVQAPASAQSLDALRASGAVGERFDGYLQARNSSAQAFVNQVNAKRRQIYQQRAKAQNVPANQVGMVYAQQILKDAPKGTWFLQPNGKWVQK
jgi:uncharacterized protein YdbL (DUF1318 family)